MPQVDSPLVRELNALQSLPQWQQVSGTERLGVLSQYEDNLFQKIKEHEMSEIKLVVKGDTDGSVEALCDSFQKLSTDEVAVNIIRKAVEEPIRWIATNAGQDGSVVIDKVKNSETGIGYDAAADEYGDMVKKGIIDPTKVVRSALENAASIAAMVLVTQSLVTDIPEKEKMPPMPPGGMGGMEGMM